MACFECGGWDTETGGYPVDHGYREPDTREKYYVESPDDDDIKVVTVTIQRKMSRCPCGSGHYDDLGGGVDYLIKGDDGVSLVVPDSACCEAIIKGLYPRHRVEKQDIYDGERELWRMENGYYD